MLLTKPWMLGCSQRYTLGLYKLVGPPTPLTGYAQVIHLPRNHELPLALQSTSRKNQEAKLLQGKKIWSNALTTEYGQTELTKTAKIFILYSDYHLALKISMKTPQGQSPPSHSQLPLPGTSSPPPHRKPSPSCPSFQTSPRHRPSAEPKNPFESACGSMTILS